MCSLISTFLFSPYKALSHSFPAVSSLLFFFNQGGSDDRGVHIRVLFTELLRAKKPLVLHNGLIDMAFLYQVPVIYSRWICISNIFCLLTKQIL